MHMGKFDKPDDIFRNERVLQEDYTPEQLTEREEEEETYIEALIPVMNNASPFNVLTYGNTGVGKTLSTRLILNELIEDTKEKDGLDVEYLWVSCKASTSYQTTVDLANQARKRNGKNPVSKSGYSESAVYDMLWAEVDNMGASHVIFVLDEVDSLGTDDDLLYKIPRARDNGDIENVHVSLIGICNNFRFRDNLSGRVKSSLCEYEIRFGPYDANQLRTILSERAEKAFIPGVVSEDVIPLTAAMVGQNSGSARHAINTLYMAGSLARKRGDLEVTEVHVRDAQGLVDKNLIEEELRDLPTQSHMVLYALCELAGEGETPASRKKLYGVYQNLAERIDADVKASRTVLNHLTELATKGILNIKEINTGRRGGARYNYELNDDRDLVMKVLKENERLPAISTN